jgi:hypothetical protein
VDINPTLLFGNQTAELVPPCHRQLQLFDPRKVSHYNELLQKQLSYHKIQDKVTSFQTKLGRGEWSIRDQEEYEKVDSIITERNKGISVHDATINRTMAAADLHGVPQYPNINTIVNALREAKWQRKELQSKHLTLWESYLQQLATSLVLKASPHLEDPKYAERLSQRIKEAAKRIQRKERRRQMYQNIGNALTSENRNRGGLSRIDVPAPTSGIGDEPVDP